MTGYDQVKLWGVKIWLDGLRGSKVLSFVDNGQIIRATELLAHLATR